MVAQRCPSCKKVAYLPGGVCEFCGKGGRTQREETVETFQSRLSQPVVQSPLKKRFRVAFLTRGELDSVEYVDTLADVKRVIAEVKRNDPFFLTDRSRDRIPHDIVVEDTKEGVDFSVDQNFRLVVM